MTSAHLSRAALGGVVAALCLAPAAHATVTISSAATSNMNCTSGVCSPTAANAVLNVGDLTTMLASGNVTVNTSTGSLAAQVEDIIVAAGFDWTSANALTLDAYRSITVTAPVADNGSGAVSLVTNDGGSKGTLSFISGGSLAFLGTANALTINGHAYVLEKNIKKLATSITAKPSGFFALSYNYDAKHDGTYMNAPIRMKFKGTFNGLGNTISHMSIRANAKNQHLGLFAYVEANGMISSIRVMEASIKAEGNSYAGVIAGMNYGTISNSAAGGSMIAAGGKDEGVEGGLVGLNEGTLSDTSASTNVEMRGNSPILNAYVGGLAGQNFGTVDQSYALGDATASNNIGRSSAGGLVGLNGSTIENCYAEGAATIGGSIGAGGLVGVNGLTIGTAYSTGAAIANDGGAFGGSIGLDESAEGSLSDVYWDTTTSGITNLSQGAGSPANDPGITGETTAQLQAALPSGFDPTIWAESPSINGGLPYLIANPPQ